MATQKAIVLQGDKKASFVTDRALPKSRARYVGVKVSAVALNPTDWKHIDFLNNPGSLSGCDFAGTVESIGEGCTKEWKTGDRICGFTHGGNNLQLEDGAFAEHIMVGGDIQMRIPKNLSDEEAATLGVGVVTCGQGLFQAMRLNLPTQPCAKAEPVLVYGGSTATGTLGIQFLKLAGYTPITTCSPRNFDLVKSYGAAAAFDYNDSSCVEQIKKFTDNDLRYAWDTITNEGSTKLCADVLVAGGTYASLSPAKMPRNDITIKSTLAYTAGGEAVEKAGLFKTDGIPEDFEFAKKWIAIVDDLLAEGKIKVHPPKVMDGGLEKLLDGLDLLKNNKVSGEKLVYKVGGM